MRIKKLIMKSGDEHVIKAEKGKYYICEDAQFRKANPDIDHIETATVAEEKPEEKKPAKKKAKKEEE